MLALRKTGINLCQGKRGSQEGRVRKSDSWMSEFRFSDSSTWDVYYTKPKSNIFNSGIVSIPNASISNDL